MFDCKNAFVEPLNINDATNVNEYLASLKYRDIFSIFCNMKIFHS